MGYAFVADEDTTDQSGSNFVEAKLQVAAAAVLRIDPGRKEGEKRGHH